MSPPQLDGRAPAAGHAARLAAALVFWVLPLAASAQPPPAGFQPVGPLIDGPAAPVPPATTLNRDASGGATVRAVRLEGPWRLDGVLDEADLRPRGAVRRLHPAGPRRGGAGNGGDRRLDLLRRRVDLRGGPRLRVGSRVAVDRQRDAARLVPAHQQRRVHRRVRHLLRPPQRLRLPGQSHRGVQRSADHRRRRSESRLESRLGRAHRPLRRRLDRRDGDPVQVAPLPARGRATVGHPVGPGHPVELRGGVSDGGADLGRAGTVPRVGGRDPHRPCRCRQATARSRSSPT